MVLQDLAEALLTDAETNDFTPDQALAAAIVERAYGGCFVIASAELLNLEQTVRAQLLPPAVRDVLGEHLSREIARAPREIQLDFLPLMVLHRCAADHPNTIRMVLRQALSLAVDPRLTWSELDEPPTMLTSTTGPISKVLPPAAQQAKDAFWAARRAERDQKNPVTNGPPHEALTPPKPELADSFSWWSLQLGFMLASPKAADADHVAAIRALGAHCLRTMPQARAQAQAKRRAEPGEEINDRYGSEHNESLPRYARWLLKAGDFAAAKEVCEMALRHRIEPASPGAFDRALATASKKLQAPAKKKPLAPAPPDRTVGTSQSQPTSAVAALFRRK